jgi:ribonucleoside-diphosphate reductase beta chain
VLLPGIRVYYPLSEKTTRLFVQWLPSLKNLAQIAPSGSCFTLLPGQAAASSDSLFDAPSGLDYDPANPTERRRGRTTMTATLEELALQGDPGTLGSDAQAQKLKLMTPQELYLLWERQQWLSQEIDFSKDKSDWSSLTGDIKEQALWGMSAFYIGEERVTTEFSGLVMSYQDEQEEAFLATQQVDEARHMQFFDRFIREVVGVDDADISARLEQMRENVNDAFVKLFDEELVEAGRRLVADPSDLESKVDFITAYHLVIEGTLALTGQEFITRYWVQNDLLPGFVEGFEKVARDEHRHVAYGTWFLKETAGKDEGLADRLRQTLTDLLPLAAEVLVPPGRQLGEDWELLGYTAKEVNEFAFQSLSRRLKAIGVPLQPAVAA